MAYTNDNIRPRPTEGVKASTLPWEVSNPTDEERIKDIIKETPKVITNTIDQSKVAPTNGNPSDASNKSSSGLAWENNTPNNIERFDRSQIALGSAETTKFPENLSEKRYLNIQIYNTIQKDPNKVVANAAATVVKTATGLFNGSASLSGVMSDVATTYKGAKETAETFQNSLSGLKDVGNPSVGSLGGAPVWMDEIWLPLPNDISEGLSHTWDEGKGALDSLYDGAAAVGGGVLSALSKSFSPSMSDGLSNNSIVKTATGYSNIVSKMTGTQALVYNENKLMQYSKTEFRSIDFKWTLVPNSEKENKSLQLIFAKLKAYSSPQAVSGKILLRAPFFCRLKFYNPTLNDALQFDECVITQIGINYSGAGTMETFNDNMPKVMELNMSFVDKEPKTLQSWAEGQKY